MAIDTLRSAAHLQRELGDELFMALISSDNTAAVKQFLQGLQPLFTLAGAIKVWPMEKFVVGDHFKVNTKKNALVKISYVEGNFKAWFLGKVEDRTNASKTIPGDGPYRTPDDTTEAVLRYHTLNKRSVDGPIIAELGGEAKAETAIAEVFALMQKQANGQQGALLTNGYANIFYVRDANLALCAVYVLWLSDGWRVIANSVEGPDKWRAGSQVFSRDS